MPIPGIPMRIKHEYSTYNLSSRNCYSHRLFYLSTGFPGSEGKGLICVYTSDWRDQEDVMRVREALRQLGFTNKLYYKTDDDTYAGVYRFTGHTNISKYQA